MNFFALRFWLAFAGVMAILGTVALCGIPELPAQTGLKSPSFTKKQLEDADALIRDIFKDELAQAKTNPDAGKKLAQTLLDQARQIKEEAEVRFTALTLARNLAADAGDQIVAFAAIAEIAKHHQVDVNLMGAETLARVIDHTTDANRAKILAEMALQMANQFSGKDDLDSAVRYGQLAESAAKKANQPGLLASVSGRLAELTTTQKETAKIQPFLVKLKANPDDPAANLEVGKSWCFARDKWEKGLPYLVKGSDLALKEVAKKELSSPLKGEGQAELALAWWDVAQKHDGPTKLQMLRRSYQWYMRAVFQLDGAEKVKVQGKIKELVQALPAKLRVTEIETELKNLTGHTAEVLGVAISPNGMQAVSGSADKSVRLWDLTNGMEMQNLKGHFGSVFAVVFTTDGKHIISTAEDRTVRLWEVSTGKEVRQFTGQTDFINGLAVSPDGKLLAGAGQDRSIYIWDIETGNKWHQLTGHTGAVFRVAFAPDGQHLASASDDQTARLWDVKTGKFIRDFRGHTGQIIGLAFSPDGKHLATGSEDNTARLWEVASGKETLRFTGHTSTVGAVTFSPEGSRLISASDDRSIRIWDAENGQLIRQLSGHTDAVYGVACSPDGRWLLSCSLDRTVKLWGERK